MEKLGTTAGVGVGTTQVGPMKIVIVRSDEAKIYGTLTFPAGLEEQIINVLRAAIVNQTGLVVPSLA